MKNYRRNQKKAQELADQLEQFVTPLLILLDKFLDKRLVQTFQRTLVAILTFRHSLYGLLLSELGGYILSPDQAPAGTKRLSNLLRSNKWGYWLIERFLWRKATEFITQQAENGQVALVLWDESVIEKSESVELEGLCAVRSSKASRLKRIKRGFYNPPTNRPIFVPGMQWLTLMVVGMAGYPYLATMKWWTNRGKFATQRQTVIQQMVRRCAYYWKRQVIHVGDRGFANHVWLGLMLYFNLRFVLRWQTKYHLVDAKGKRCAWHIARGKRTLDSRVVWDARRQCYRKIGIVYIAVTHPDFPDMPLFLVVSRPGKHLKPWYLLTSEPITCLEDAWQIIFIYVRRWQIEMTYRYAKSELAIESPRLWAWKNRIKIMMMVALVYAFLLSLLDSQFDDLRHWLLRHWCHRTGTRYQHFSIPLYRIRSALSRLWLSHPPSFLFSWKNSG